MVPQKGGGGEGEPPPRPRSAAGRLLERLAAVLAVGLVEARAHLVALADALVLELVEGEVVGDRDGHVASAAVVLEGRGGGLAVAGEMDLRDRTDDGRVFGGRERRESERSRGHGRGED